MKGFITVDDTIGLNQCADGLLQGLQGRFALGIHDIMGAVQHCPGIWIQATHDFPNRIGRAFCMSIILLNKGQYNSPFCWMQIAVTAREEHKHSKFIARCA